jgi:hypothetical protein
LIIIGLHITVASFKEMRKCERSKRSQAKELLEKNEILCAGRIEILVVLVKVSFS